MSDLSEMKPSLPIQVAIQSIADKYRVDPHDPLFSVLEKMDEYHLDLKAGFIGVIPEKIATLKELIQTFQLKADELTQVAFKLSESGNVFGENAKVVAESTDGLTRYWKQIHLRYAFIGMLITFILCGGAFGFFYYQSADWALSQAGVTLKSEPGTKGKRLTLTGKNLIAAGRKDSELTAEFSK